MQTHKHVRLNSSRLQTLHVIASTLTRNDRQCAEAQRATSVTCILSDRTLVQQAIPFQYILQHQASLFIRGDEH
jgi:hypothetical protein